MKAPLLLGVNIDHSATVRQARYRNEAATCGGMIEPDPVALALCAERAGADAITLHLREDRRHIQDRDVYRLREAMQTHMNLEMAATDEMEAIALKVSPAVVLLVPEGRAEVTTEGGLDILTAGKALAERVQRLQQAGIEVSLFIDPDTDQIAAAARTGARSVELHTGAYAHACHDPAKRAAEYARLSKAAEYARLSKAAEAAHQAGLRVNAGHGINYVNVREIRNLPHLHELNIGHSIISRALFTGIDEAVREMKARMR